MPMDAFKLLSTTDEIVADELSTHLNKINDERKGLVASMVKEMKHTISAREDSVEKKRSDCARKPEMETVAFGTCREYSDARKFLPSFSLGQRRGKYFERLVPFAG